VTCDGYRISLLNGLEFNLGERMFVTNFSRSHYTVRHIQYTVYISYNYLEKTSLSREIPDYSSACESLRIFGWGTFRKSTLCLRGLSQAFILSTTVYYAPEGRRMNELRNSKAFILRWIDKDGGIITSVGVEFVQRRTLGEAIASIGRRCSQSAHLVPENATGFYLCPYDDDPEYGKG